MDKKINTEKTCKKFSELNYPKPDVDQLEDYFKQALKKIKQATAEAQLLEIYQDLEKKISEYLTYRTLLVCRRRQAPEDDALKIELFLIEEGFFRIMYLFSCTLYYLLYGKFYNELKKQLSFNFIKRANDIIRFYMHKNYDQYLEEIKLIYNYQQELNSMAFLLDNKLYSYYEWEKLLRKPLASQRSQYLLAISAEFKRHQEQLDEVYQGLLTLRKDIAQNTNYKSYSEFSEMRLARGLVKHQDIVFFRKYCKQYFLPITIEIRRLQRRRLGLTELNFVDLACMLKQKEPLMKVQGKRFIKCVVKFLEKELPLGPNFWGDYFEGGYVTFYRQKEKFQGPYFSILPNEKLPCLRMVEPRTMEDLGDFIYYCGLVYSYCTGVKQGQYLIEKQRREQIHQILAIGLEYLVLFNLALFFKSEDVALCQDLFLSRALQKLLMDLATDEFLTLLYAPEQHISDAERYQLWHQIESAYRPDVEHSGDGYFNFGMAYQLDEYSVQQPFSSAERSLGHFFGLTFWTQGLKDEKKAFALYRLLAQKAKYHDIKECITEFNLKSPFEEDSFKKLAYRYCAYLKL